MISDDEKCMDQRHLHGTYEKSVKKIYSAKLDGRDHLEGLGTDEVAIWRRIWTFKFILNVNTYEPKKIAL
jgi:hypothetical protein